MINLISNNIYYQNNVDLATIPFGYYLIKYFLISSYNIITGTIQSPAAAYLGVT